MRCMLGQLVLFFTMLIGNFLFTQDMDVGSFVIMNGDTCRVLAQKNGHQKLYPASTTKIATVVYVLQNAAVDLSQKIVVPAECVKTVSDEEKSRNNFGKYPSYILEAHSSTAGFKAGEIVSLEDLLYGAMVSSGNDAANVLAYYWGNKSIEQFMEQLNRFIESLGCVDTHFENPHGLHHPDHVSSAYDLGLMAACGLKNPLFAKIVSTKTYSKMQSNKQPAVSFVQTNRLLLDGPLYCSVANGVKTGYHKRAQHCFVGSASNENRRLIVVLMQCKDRKNMFAMAKKLLEKFMNEQRVTKHLVDKGSIALTRSFEGSSVPLSLLAAESFDFVYYPSEVPHFQAEVSWMDVSFPIVCGQKVGKIYLYADGKEVKTIDLLSGEERKPTFSQRIASCRAFLQEHKICTITIVAIIVMILVGMIVRSARHR